jgi:hypothetical protein
MGQIYRRANNVVAWLGPDPFGKAKRCFSILSRKRDLEVTHPEAAALSELMTCERFSRLWVVQEVILAQNSEFVWGSESIPAKTVQLNARGYHRGASHDKTVWIGEIRSYARDFDLLEVLTWTRGLRCYDDRDHVYALLGLPYSEDPPIATTIVPDYQTTTIQLYTTLMCKFVDSGSMARLWTLMHNSRQWSHEDFELPSWIIDWRLSPDSFGVRSKLQESDAEPMSSPRAVPNVSGEELTVHGVTLAIVRDVAPDQVLPDHTFWSQFERTME